MSLRLSFKKLRALWRDQRGQALVEYSTFLFFGFGTAAATGWLYFGPQLLDHMNKYLVGIYTMLNLPMP